MTLYTTSDLPILDATPLGVTTTTFFDLPPFQKSYDMIIVTSKNVINALEKSSCDWRDIPLVCVGEKTASYAKKRGVNVLYTASGYGKELSSFLANSYPHATYFYPHAKKVAFDIAGALRLKGIKVDECVAYETLCSSNVHSIVDDAVIIFGAPSSVTCFLSTYGWKETWKAIAIGATTAGAFPPLISCIVSPTPSYEDALQYALKVFKR